MVTTVDRAIRPNPARLTATTRVASWTPGMRAGALQHGDVVSVQHGPGPPLDGPDKGHLTGRWLPAIRAHEIDLDAVVPGHPGVDGRSPCGDARAPLLLPAAPDAIAPVGSDVRVLLRTDRGSMAHFTLAPGQVSGAVVHRTVDEIWYVLGGHGQMWRAAAGRSEVVELAAGVSLTIPVGTAFQFRCTGTGPLTIVGVTMPPWPGEQEAMIVDGAWPTSDREPQVG
jgi:mannose-6-phosphate isomerase-like protein (cupin superfamily)